MKTIGLLQRLLRTDVLSARADVRYSVRFTTSAPNVVVVDSSGVMSAVAAGSAVVTVVAHSDGGAGLKAVTLSNATEVTVTKP